MINGICEKEGVHYEEYGQTLTLSEYTNLKSSLADVVRKAAKEGMEKKVVSKLN